MERRFLLVVLVALCLGAASAALAQVENAVGIWLFDEGSGEIAKDGSGLGNNGKIIGAKYVDGKFGKALQMNGADQYVQVPDAKSLDLETELSMVCWFNWEGSGDGWQTFFSKGPMSGTNENWALFINTGSKYFHFVITPNGGRTNFDSPGGAFDAKKWTHVAATYDGKTRRIYVNGKMVGETGTSGKTTPNDNFLGIGWREGSSHWWKGSLDEMAVFNKAITEKQITTIYEQGIDSLLAVQPKDKVTVAWGEIKRAYP